ncbi:Carnosine N-methyltransferase [Diplonema papillatum]|nr:Carnosine N-methyltransferase [Diplonema papillatum]
MPSTRPQAKAKRGRGLRPDCEAAKFALSLGIALSLIACSGAVLGRWLTPGAFGELDAGTIFERESTQYAAALHQQLDLHNLTPEDARALGGQLNKRREGVKGAVEALDVLSEMFRDFRRTNRSRGHMVVDRTAVRLHGVTHTPSKGYCSMHDLLTQIVRDWADDEATQQSRDEGFELVYRTVLDALEGEAATAGRRNLTVLVPGDGLCRLSWQLSRDARFAAVEANEASPLFADFADFIVNGLDARVALRPYAGNFLNQNTVRGLYRAVNIPDPSLLHSRPPAAEHRLVVGSFEVLYSPGAARHRLFDCVVTSFFIDTLSTPVPAVLSIISSLLSPGGVWVNYGPLKYHHDHSGSSLKLTFEELVALLPSRDLRVVRSERLQFVPYYEPMADTLQPRVYNPRLLVAVKTPPSGEPFVCGDGLGNKCPA